MTWELFWFSATAVALIAVLRLLWREAREPVRRAPFAEMDVWDPEEGCEFEQTKSERVPRPSIAESPGPFGRIDVDPGD